MDHIVPNFPLHFKVDATQIRKITRIAHIGMKPASMAKLEVTSTALRYSMSTVDDRFKIVAIVPLHEPNHEVGAQFLLSSTLLSKIGRLFEGILPFTLDPGEDTLHLQRGGYKGQFTVSTLPAEPGLVGENSVIRATLPTATLSEAISQAGLFAGRPDKSFVQYNGLRIGECAARSGYSSAVAKYAGSTIPEVFEAIVPKRHISNLSAVLAKLSGSIDLLVSDTTVGLRSSEAEISWVKEGNWPASLDRMFQRPITSSFTVLTSELQKSVMLLSMALDWVEIRTEKKDDLGRLILAGHGKNGRGHTPLSTWTSLDDLSNERWNFALNVPDLLSAALSVRTDRAELQVIDRGLYIRSAAPSYDVTTLLLGSQRT
jgi:hypothetical protein